MSHGASSEKIYAVGCDLVQNSMSAYAVGGPTATVGSVKPLITTFILMLPLSGQNSPHWKGSDIKLILNGEVRAKSFDTKYQ